MNTRRETTSDQRINQSINQRTTPHLTSPHLSAPQQTTAQTRHATPAIPDPLETCTVPHRSALHSCHSQRDPAPQPHFGQQRPGTRRLVGGSGLRPLRVMMRACVRACMRQTGRQAGLRSLRAPGRGWIQVRACKCMCSCLTR